MHREANRVKAIFDRAVEINSTAERDDFVLRECADDAELRAKVQVLLGAYDQAGSFLESPPIGVQVVTVDQPPPMPPGTLVGPYKLLQPIGEGGMGTVYMAEQTVPVRRTVALKLIKAGMDSRQVLARFGAERQALALMDHPNIAKVFDAGSTDTGGPYFVMELVKGIPITRFCDERRLTTRERLELAIPVCQAVQHAHQKGIIHRDIKPSNVLIALYDGKPVPKVIDFGVAKATGPRLTDQTLYTEFGAVVGTLEYMSPEQAELNQLDIDTRSDIYSLGVLLYELLTGSTPLDRNRLKQGAILEMLRVIREEESPRPSMRLSTTEELPSIAACRNIEPRKLSGLVRGELDWIIMKALEKDRNRRYETANGLAADLRRYLDDEPVQACPPSVWYRFGKFARRNKASLVAAGLISVALVAAVAVLTVSNVMITRERNQKQAALLQAKDSAKAANDQRGIAEQSARQADEQRGIAIVNVKAVREQELLARRRFYAAQTNLAQQAWDIGQPARVLELLESQRPKFDQEDLRGFDWYYLWGLCRAGFRMSLRAHTSTVGCVVFSPDGRDLASNSDGNLGYDPHHAAAKLWDVATGRERFTLKRHWSESSWDVAFSPDGKTLATVGRRRSTRFWDTASGEERASFKQQSDRVAFFPDGKTLITQRPQTGSKGGNDLELWDATTGKERAILRANPGEGIGRVAVAPDGKCLAAGTSEGQVRLWTLKGTQWQERLTIPGHGWCPCVTFSPDCKILAVGGQALALYDPGTGKEWRALHGHVGTVFSVAFSPDGNTLASGGNDRTVRTWDTDTGKQQSCRPHAGPVLSVAFSPDRKDLASAGGDATIKLWEVAPAPADVVLSHGGSVFSIAFTSDGRTLVSSGLAPTKHWDVATGHLNVAPPMEWAKDLKGEDISPDARTQALQGPDGTVTLCDLITGRRGAVFSGHTASIPCVAFSPDGKTVATGSYDGTARLWDLLTGQPRVTMTPNTRWGVSAVAFSPDGTLLALGSQFQFVSLWDVATGRKRLELQTGEKAGTGSFVWSVAFSPDGKILAVSSDQGSVRLWDVTTGTSRGSVKGHTDLIHVVAFSPDGNTLVTGSDDKTAKLWDVATGQERLTLKGHTLGIISLAFAPDGNTLATGSADTTVRLWHTSRHPEATARNNEEDPDDPETAQALNNAGDRLWSIGRLEESERAYRKALVRASTLTKAFPDNLSYLQELARSWNSLSLLLATSGQAKGSAEARREAIGLFHNLPPISRQALARNCTDLADSLRTTGHADEASRAYDQAVEICPDNSHCWFRRAYAHAQIGQFEKATDGFSKVIELNPGDQVLHLAWANRGEAQARLGHPDKALADFSRALELRPQEPEFWFSRALANLGSSRLQQAIADYETGLELDPKSAKAHNALAWLLATCQELKLRNPQRAIKLGKTAVDLEPKEGGFWNTVGVAHYRADDWKAAIEALTKSVEFGNGGDSNDWFFLAMAHWQLGDTARASFWYDKAIAWMDKNQPKNEDLIRFRAEAAALLGVKKKKD